jgi:hypothetical protein
MPSFPPGFLSRTSSERQTRTGENRDRSAAFLKGLGGLSVVVAGGQFTRLGKQHRENQSARPQSCSFIAQPQIRRGLRSSRGNRRYAAKHVKSDLQQWREVTNFVVNGGPSQTGKLAKAGVDAGALQAYLGAPQHPAHSPLYGAGTRSVQGFLAGLTSPSPANERFSAALPQEVASQ